ncbi:MAG: ParA family protein [Planctomycetes bacterium]|nr:ParA family protein [Planctomycetota bacterium]
MHTYALANHKGGSGKTTTAIHLAGALAARGRRVLLIDLDPQAHATLGLSSEAEDSPCALEVLTGEVRALDALHAAPGGITLIPSHGRLAEFEERAARELGSEGVLRRVLAPLAGRFDECLLDCPPRADGLLTANAICACDTLLLTVETGAFALQGALKAQEIVDATLAAARHAPELRVVATMFDRRLRIAREVLIAMQARFGARLYDTAIRSSARLREAAGAGVPIQLLAPRSTAAQDFAALADELALFPVGA